MWPFSKKPKGFTPDDDRCWLTAFDLERGAAAEALAAFQAGPVLIVVHFPNSIDQAGDAITQAGGAIELARSALDAPAMRSRLQSLEPGRMLLALSSQLKPPTPTPTDDPSQAFVNSRPPLTIIAWERHPLRERDDLVTSFAAELNRSFECSLRFHCALDGPPMSMFAGETTMNLLRQMGMKSGDAIDHPTGRSPKLSP